MCLQLGLGITFTVHNLSTHLSTSQFQQHRVTDDTRFPFGKYKGTPMADVPASYLLWLEKKPWMEQKFGNFIEYIRLHMEQLQQETARANQWG